MSEQSPDSEMPAEYRLMCAVSYAQDTLPRLDESGCEQVREAIELLEGVRNGVEDGSG